MFTRQFDHLVIIPGGLTVCGKYNNNVTGNDVEKLKEIKMKTDNEYMYELKALVDGPHNFLSNLARAKKYEELRHWIK